MSDHLYNTSKLTDLLYSDGQRIIKQKGINKESDSSSILFYHPLASL